MKTNLLKAIALALVMTPLYNCSVEPTEQLTTELETTQLVSEQLLDGPCNEQDPKFRLSNDSANLAQVEILDANDVLIAAISDLNPGEISDWESFSPGVTRFTISTVESTKSIRIDMGLCMVYDVTINVNNQLNTGIPTQL